MRLALFGTLWARGRGGAVVASTENRSALDDLHWLGIEPDEMAAPVDGRRALEAGQELVAANKAYPCFCSVAELREMTVNPVPFPEQVLYDHRCRKLSLTDRAALERMGRKARVRVIVPEEPREVEGIEAARPKADFAIIEQDGTPTALFSAVLSARDAQATDLLVDADRAHELAHWLVVADALGWTLPRLRVFTPWLTPEGAPIGQKPDGLTISELRARGFHPQAILATAARAGWDPGAASSLAEMGPAFDLDAVQLASPTLDMQAMLTRNGDTLRALDRGDLLAAMSDHLERKGFPFASRDPAWQARFVDAVAKEMTTLSDAEGWAVLLLTSTADYDREVARVLRSTETQELITEFEKAMDKVDNNGEDARSWRVVLADFRRDATAPGRALATMRMVLTGQREGPGLPPILALLGVDGCRQRLEKARRYAAG